MPSQIITLISVSAVMFLVIGGLAFISHYYMDGKPLPCSCTERNSADHSACDL